MIPPKPYFKIVLFAVLFFNQFIFSQGQLLKIVDSSKSCVFDTSRLNSLINNDSLYKATTLLNEAISFSKTYNLNSTQAKSYYSLGKVLTKMSNYKNSEVYYLKALKIYSETKDTNGKNLVFSGLVDNFITAKNYDKLDSIYPIAQKLSKKLKSELYFKNLEARIRQRFYTQKNQALLDLTNFAIDSLQNTAKSSINFSDKEYKYDLHKRLLPAYKFYNSIAKIKYSNYKPESFNPLFTLDEEDLKIAFEDNFGAYRKLATLNYYKYLYYSEAKKNLDSAIKYLLISDTYKYDGLSKYEKRNAKNGELLYKIISTEQELKVANEIRNKDAKTSNIYLVTAILTSILLLGTLIIFYFYYKAEKNIQTINKQLIDSNKKLIEIDKDRLEFFSILSHELRTPIYGITGLATLLKQEDNKKKSESYLNSLISSSNYLSILIDNILQVNRLRFEEKNLRLKPDKIYKIVDHVVSTVKIAAENKGLELKTNIQPSDEDELILIDKVAFSQILINLAYNAIRYTKEGYVSITVIENKRTQNNVTLLFKIKDTGIGIKEEHRSVVFNAFDNKTFLNKNSSGSGLGLHIVKTLLNSHNAEIDFTSTPNEGTTFYFEITFETVMAKTIKPIKEKLIFKGKKHILIVDDNKINLLITKKNIEKIEGYTSEIVSNGIEAISMIKNKHYDLILMDINMPEMDGFEVTEKIRLFNKSIPIIALTALNSSEISVKAENYGINQIITKPYIFADFEATITKYSGLDNNSKTQIDCATM